MDAEPSSTIEAPKPTLGQLAWLFLRLGSTAFGGPAAHIAMIHDEVVTKRRWLTREKFLDLLGAVNLIPGPNSTEMAIHIGHLAGWLGLIVAGACFIVPAALLTGILAWAYVEYGTLPQAAGIFYGVKPVVIAIVVQALWKFCRDALRTPWLAVIGLVALGLEIAKMNELVVLLVGGMLAMLGRRRAAASVVPVLPLLGAVAPPAVGLGPIFLFFLKVGSVLFGSGYVLLAFLRTDLVENYHWLTEAQLLDAVAVGQFTPGPVFTTATFIGYLLMGPAGAVVATLGIFLPAFVFVALSGPLIPRVRRSPSASAFLDGVIVASLALMVMVTWELGRSALVDWITIGIALVAAAILLRFRINSVWLIFAGGLIGFAKTTWWAM
jgi:chromate transporter